MEGDGTHKYKQYAQHDPVFSIYCAYTTKQTSK
jgi:hypothetical protein